MHRLPLCFLLCSLPCLPSLLACAPADDTHNEDPTPDPDVEDPRVPGDPDDAFASALAYQPYDADPAHYATDAEDLPGLLLSFNTVVAVVDPDTTIGAMNALLAQHDADIVGVVPDTSASVGALVALRLPTTSHAQMSAALPALIEEPALHALHRDLLQAEPDGALFSEPIIPLPTPGAAANTPPGWTWEREDQPQPGTDANWGLETLRVPQLWNLAAGGASSPGVVVGVLDGGFVSHVDFVMENQSPALEDTSASAALLNNHGMHVAGTIGALVDNGRGMDGVNPFARLVGKRYVYASVAFGLADFIEQNAELDVVNASLGENWYLKAGAALVNPNHDAAAQFQVQSMGEALRLYLEGRTARGVANPIIIVAAGNDSNHAGLGGEDILARWGSAITNAALEEATPGILVVEAANQAFERASFSNVGGHVSAPGVGIVSLGAVAPFFSSDGTSMATPHVSGVVSFLLALTGPGATPEQVLQAVQSTAFSPADIEDVAPMVDAFAAALELDAIRGDDRMLRRLADMDDGTDDGNLRVDPSTFVPVLDDTKVARDGVDLGPAGDGTVDMRDFRRFRDALLLVEDEVDLALDGAADHPKRDLNQDDVLGSALEENVFPRFDLNGDGRVSRTQEEDVGGRMQALATDLEVLQFVWEDEEVSADTLPQLLDSGDVHADATDLLALGTYGAVELSFVGTISHTVRLDLDRPSAVVTLPVGTSALTVSYLDTSDVLVQTLEDAVTIGLGADVAYRVADTAQDPPYYLSVFVNANRFATCGGEPLQFWMEASVEDYDTEDGLPGIGVSFVFDGVGRGAGTTDASGRATSNTFQIMQPGTYSYSIVVEGFTETSTSDFTVVTDCRGCPETVCARTEDESVVCGLGSTFEDQRCQAAITCQCEIERCDWTSSQGADSITYTCGPF